MEASLPRQRRRFASIAEAADLVGASTKTIRRRIADGSLTGYRMGPRLIRVDLAELDAILSPIPTVEAAPPLSVKRQRDRLAPRRRGDGEPPGDPVAPSIRRDHVRRDSGSATPESLTRDAHRLLDACGIARSPKWIQRVVRDYCSASASGLPFGMYLTNRVELNAQQRQVVLDRDDLRYLLEYVDPTGETAVRNVLREKSTDGASRE